MHGVGFKVQIHDQTVPYYAYITYADNTTQNVALPLASLAGPAHRRLVSVLLDDPQPLLFHAEPLYRGDTSVGYLRSGSYGWTLGGAVGLAMVDAGDAAVTADWTAGAAWSVDVAGQRVPARVSLQPFYDPASSRVRV